MRHDELAEHYSREAGIDHTALVALTRAAMAFGAVAFIEKARAGEVPLDGPIGDAFGDFPAEFLRIRPSLIEALTARPSDTEESDHG